MPPEPSQPRRTHPRDRPRLRDALVLDPRSLGLARIGLGLALLVDLGRRSAELTLWYTNEGLLPNHTVLWQPIIKRLFSLFFMVSLPHEAALAFVVCAICFLALAIGYRTRLAHALSLLAFVSLRNRVIFIEDEGSALLGALMLWTLFLPMARRFSVDAVSASLRARPEHSAADVDAARFPPRDTTPVLSLAGLAVVLQLAAALGLSFANRSGAAWGDGTAAHYLLHQDRTVTALGVLVREQAGPAALAALTGGLRVMPLVAAALLIASMMMPAVLAAWARRAAVVLIALLVLVTAALVNVGSGGVALLAFLPLLLTARDWDALARRAGRRSRARLVFFDGDCGICFYTVRVLRRLDPFGRLRSVANDDPASFPPGFKVEPGLLDRTILVVDPASGRRWTRADAVAETFMMLPAGWLVALFLRAPIIRSLAAAVYDRVAANRTRISVWLGLAACGVPQRPPAPGRAPADVTVSPAQSRAKASGWRSWARAHQAHAREWAAALVLLVLAADALASNPGLPAALQLERPAWVATAIGYSGLQQAWTRWAPEPPRTDRMVFVDAETTGGNHFDPFNQAGSRVHDLPVTRIPGRLGESALFAAFVARIPERGVYHQAFLEWVERAPARTGQLPIVGFDAWVIDDDSPPPGETLARNARSRLFLHHVFQSPAPPAPQKSQATP